MGELLVRTRQLNLFGRRIKGRKCRGNAALTGCAVLLLALLVSSPAIAQIAQLLEGYSTLVVQTVQWLDEYYAASRQQVAGGGTGMPEPDLDKNHYTSVVREWLLLQGSAGGFSGVRAMGPPLSASVTQYQPLPSGVLWSVLVNHGSGYSVWQLGMTFSFGYVRKHHDEAETPEFDKPKPGDSGLAYVSYKLMPSPGYPTVQPPVDAQPALPSLTEACQKFPNLC